ncbi:acyl carrier protein [Helicobacter anseris]|uniref:Acyl carrier protein n=1 Tax=Helicobacter anseris TaxID=375926 RepID=A0A3D8J8V1_9HELI|nr:acyl carrier protein [Helicobacter anseris]RDU73852.1 acyl carrier protein [Helicobacter anseris]
MTQQELLLQIQDALQRDEALELSTKLNEIEEWDSLAIVSMISLYDTLFHLSVTGNELRNCKSVQDLVDIVKDKLSK